MKVGKKHTSYCVFLQTLTGRYLKTHIFFIIMIKKKTNLSKILFLRGFPKRSAFVIVILKNKNTHTYTLYIFNTTIMLRYRRSICKFFELFFWRDCYKDKTSDLGIQYNRVCFRYLRNNSIGSEVCITLFLRL